MGNSTLG